MTLTRIDDTTTMTTPHLSTQRSVRGTARRSRQCSRALAVGLAVVAALTVASAVPVPGSASARPMVTGGKSTAGQLQSNGRPPKGPSPFLFGASPVAGMESATSATDALSRLPLNGGLFSLLIIGSDARPGEKVVRSRGDSVHLLLINPVIQRGTLIGFPRDSFVPIAGHGSAKLTSALAWGGPELMVNTIQTLTKIPVTSYVVTGFAGFSDLVDAVGGVNVLVDPAMNDRFSGARFERGWFSMNGPAALAFNRDRHDVANGDFGRSANQGRFLLSALARLRESTSDSKGLVPWIAAMKQSVNTNLPLRDLLVLAQAARSIPPSAITSVVVAGTNAKVKKQAVVKLTPAAYALLLEVAADGVL